MASNKVFYILSVAENILSVCLRVCLVFCANAKLAFSFKYTNYFALFATFMCAVIQSRQTHITAKRFDKRIRHDWDTESEKIRKLSAKLKVILKKKNFSYLVPIANLVQLIKQFLVRSFLANHFTLTCTLIPISSSLPPTVTLNIQPCPQPCG